MVLSFSLEQLIALFITLYVFIGAGAFFYIITMKRKTKALKLYVVIAKKIKVRNIVLVAASIIFVWPVVTIFLTYIDFDPNDSDSIETKDDKEVVVAVSRAA